MILVYLPKELQDRYPPGRLMLMVYPLYGLAEAGIHWFGIYQAHHRNRLGMSLSAYDPCLS